MRGPATERLGLDGAPLGLGFVQDLINTSSLHPQPRFITDLLSDLGTAREWVASALARWSADSGQDPVEVDLAERDLPALRRLREEVRSRLMADTSDASHTGGAPLRGSITITSPSRDTIGYRPSGLGADAVEALVAAEQLLAQRADTVRRLKTCPGDHCGIAFYDNSKNASRVWHDARTCGNRHNLRASRERRRGEVAPA